MFINRTRPSRYMVSQNRLTVGPRELTLLLKGIMMMLWATVSALTALSKDFVGLLLTRFFLGVTEAPYYPGAVYILSVFYNRKEIATRIAILYTGNVLATAFAGLIAAGVFHGMDNAMGLAGWQWLFILQGAVTFVMSVHSHSAFRSDYANMTLSLVLLWATSCFRISPSQRNGSPKTSGSWLITEWNWTLFRTRVRRVLWQVSNRRLVILSYGCSRPWPICTWRPTASRTL